MANEDIKHWILAIGLKEQANNRQLYYNKGIEACHYPDTDLGFIGSLAEPSSWPQALLGEQERFTNIVEPPHNCSAAAKEQTSMINIRLVSS